MLVINGIASEIVVVDDNNWIHRQVSKFRPRIVVIEAIWVVPEKFSVLQRLHPSVKWVVRIHSNIPFMSCEGIAMDWILDYVSFKKMYASRRTRRKCSPTSRRFASGKYGVLDKSIVYLPNYYPTAMSAPKGIRA